MAFSEKLNFKNLGLGPGQLWLMGSLIFPCCVFSLAYYILTAPRLRNVDGFILPILQKVVKIYIHDIFNFFKGLKGPFPTYVQNRIPLHNLKIRNSMPVLKKNSSLFPVFKWKPGGSFNSFYHNAHPTCWFETSVHWEAQMFFSTDYGHTKAKSLILCGSNPNPK